MLSDDMGRGDASVGNDRPTVVTNNDIGFSVLFEDESIHTTSSSENRSVDIYEDCVLGVCTCEYYLGGVATQLKPCRFGAILVSDYVPVTDDLRVLDYVFHGVDLLPVGTVVDSYFCNNYNSVLEPGVKKKIDVLLRNEIAAGSLSVTDVIPTCVHAIGAIDKPNGGVRPIVDCSRPPGASINDKMSTMDLDFSYKSVEDVVDVLCHDDFMGVIDLKNAYRAVCINPDHICYQGLSWCFEEERVFLCDRRLCFGSKCGPFYFNMFSEFVYRICVFMFNVRMVNYLDDFLHICGNYDECIATQCKIVSLLRFLGFHVSWGKIISPTRCPVYLGIEIDSRDMVLRLPPGKLEKLRIITDKFLDARRATKKQLERLSGLLAHCATVVRGGRTFCRSIYNLEKLASKNPRKCVNLTAEVVSDIEWWNHFAHIFNGRATIQKPRFELCQYSDASLRGFAVFLGVDWVAGVWEGYTFPFSDTDCTHWVDPPDIPPADIDNINVYELAPVLMGIRRWAPRYSQSLVTIKTDNMQVFFMIRSGRSRNNTCMRWLKEIFWVCVEWDIELETEYVTSESNELADALSRLGYFSTHFTSHEIVKSCELCCKESLLCAMQVQSLEACAVGDSA